MNFIEFKKKNKELLEHLENSGFHESNYGTENFPCMYWHFENDHYSSLDALKYYEEEGICLFSGPDTDIYVIKNIQDVNSICEVFKTYLKQLYEEEEKVMKGFKEKEISIANKERVERTERIRIKRLLTKNIF